MLVCRCVVILLVPGRGERRKFRRLPVAAGMLACELCQYTTDKTSDMQLHFQAGLRGKGLGCKVGEIAQGRCSGVLYESVPGLERNKEDPCHAFL